MKINVNHRSPVYGSYRAACVRSLYNVDNTGFALEAELPIEQEPWAIGLVVGPSGSGKSSLGARIWGADAVYAHKRWPVDAPIIDAIAPDGGWDDVTAALSAVGLGSVPAWLRPFDVLSTGEKFRAELARVVSEAPRRVVIDEFTSVVDRQIAQIGATAFARAWRRTGGQSVLLSCHYDIIDWLAPDWIFDTAAGEFTWTRGRLRRPDIALDIFQTNWRFWPLFEPHHYLKLPRMIAAVCYVGFVGETPVAHVGVSTRPGMKEARACRLVVMPEWQGAGVGLRFLNEVCRLWRFGENRFGKPMRTLFHTSHPGMAAALRRSKLWTQVSGVLCGDDKVRCSRTLAASAAKSSNGWNGGGVSGYGGHFRAVQGFRYLGEDVC
jgi:ABC-type ATPase with predicted acetyltransferase domain